VWNFCEKISEKFEKKFWIFFGEEIRKNWKSFGRGPKNRKNLENFGKNVGEIERDFGVFAVGVWDCGGVFPPYIRALRRRKVGKKIRESAATGEKSKIFTELHAHKSGTPNLAGGMLLLVMAVMLGLGEIVQSLGWITNSLVNREETYVLLFAFFSMGALGLLDDWLNVKGRGAVKGLSARAKLLGMFVIAGFVSRWFWAKLGMTTLNLWPIAGTIELGRGMMIFSFLLLVSVVNAINITDGLDGLAGGLMAIVLGVLAVLTFAAQTFIATTVLAIVISSLLAFLWFNINPAKIFMGDGGALGLGGLLTVLVLLLNLRGIGIFVPFVVLFGIFVVDTLSSGLQIFWKKVFKKKLFVVAPLHHLLEKRGVPETHIVMKARLIQGVLAVVTLMMIFYQGGGKF